MSPTNTRRARLASLALAALPPLACAGVPGADLAPAVAPARLEPAAARAAAPAPSALARGLAAVDARALASDARFLADDALEGRGTPSSGQRAAARYLLARLERLGLAPGTRDGFLHRFSLESKAVDPARTAVAWEGGLLTADLAYARGFGLHPYDARSGRWEGEVVFGGEGDADELAACDAQGRWVVCVDQRYGRRRTLQRDAAQRGALGLVLVGGAGEREPPFERWAEQSARLRPSWPSEVAPEDLPTLWLPPESIALPAGLAPGEPLPGRLALSIAGGGAVELENVAALWPGRGPRAGEAIVVSAHYDHMGRDRAGEVMNGADDNASGTAGLLALGEALVAHGPLERSVLLLWVSAEELGLYGSRAWCETPDLPAGLTPVANVNLDMIGRNAPLYVELTPSPEHEAYNPLAEAALALVEREGFDPPTYVDRDFERSDQASFHGLLGIPVVYLSCGEHDDYHEPSDDADKLDPDKMARVVRLVLRLLVQVQGAPLGPS